MIIVYNNIETNGVCVYNYDIVLDDFIKFNNYNSYHTQLISWMFDMTVYNS